MNHVSRSTLGATVFLLGCATGGVASHYAAKASAAPPPEGTTRWAYLCFEDDRARSVQARANQVGAAGWELVSSALTGGSDMSSPIWCFKRPL